jgi:hypothetical protein
MTKLRCLNLSDNQFVTYDDIIPIRKLVSLRVLKLQGTINMGLPLRHLQSIGDTLNNFGILFVLAYVLLLDYTIYLHMTQFSEISRNCENCIWIAISWAEAFHHPYLMSFHTSSTWTFQTMSFMGTYIWAHIQMFPRHIRLPIVTWMVHGT